MNYFKLICLLPLVFQQEVGITGRKLAELLQLKRYDEYHQMIKEIGSIKNLPKGKNSVISPLIADCFTDYHYGEILTGIRLAVKDGADVDENDGFPIRRAAQGDKHQKILKRLLEYGANPNPPKAESPLSRSYYDNIKILVEAGADVNHYPVVVQVPPYYSPPIAPIHGAAFNGDVRILEHYIKKGVNINLVSRENGENALHVAVNWKKGEMIKALLRHGVKRNVRNKDGLTPLDLAKKLKYAEGIKLLSSGRS